MSNPTSPSCCPPGSHQAPPDDDAAAAFDDTHDSAKPQGELLKLGSPTSSTPCYYTPPSANSDVGLVVYPDVWGFQSRILLLCDSLAQHLKLHVVCVDCFRGETYAQHKDEFSAWLARTPYHPIVSQDTQACLDHLRSKGVQRFVAAGFCWGAWAIGKSSVEIPWQAAVAFHPSFRVEQVAFQGNDVAIMQQITCPLLLLVAENDLEYTKPGSPELKGMAPAGSKSILYPGMVHGWMTRGDRRKDKAIDEAIQSAMREAVHFFRDHL